MFPFAGIYLDQYYNISSGIKILFGGSWYAVGYRTGQNVAYALESLILMAVSAGVTKIIKGFGSNFWEPTKSPGKGWEWRGAGKPGSSAGNWYNPKTKESLHPDLWHAEGIAPHWDFKASNGKWYRIFSDGTIKPK